MHIAVICFTAEGGIRARQIAGEMKRDGHMVRVFAKSRYVQDEGILPVEGALSDWTGRMFAEADALVYVAACGIAVRGIAPFVRDKKTDPAVVVVDEQGRFCISLLSGHLGGANALTERIAGAVGAVPVVTTATDVRGNAFAVDLFAKKNGLHISDMRLAREVTAALLAGGEIAVFCETAVSGRVPQGLKVQIKTALCDRLNGHTQSDGSAQEKAAERRWDEPVREKAAEQQLDGPFREKTVGPQAGSMADDERVTEQLDEAVFPEIYVGIERKREQPLRTLYLTPAVVTVGIGCRRDTPEELIRELVEEVCQKKGIAREALRQVASIDLKKEEPGLLAFCRSYELPFLIYGADELRAASGTFRPSAFVNEVTGVDNVCERSAVLASGGRLIQEKITKNGVALALAVEDWSVTF